MTRLLLRAAAEALSFTNWRTLRMFHGDDMHTHLVLEVGGVIVIALGVLAYLRVHRKTRSCADCGSPSRFGHSSHAGSAMKDISQLCLNCLNARLAVDCGQFEGRALVIEPAANFPCYVFQPSSKSKDQKLGQETGLLLSKMEETCTHCGAKANFLWLTSKGLVENNAERLLTEGVSETLLRWGNSPPRSVCGRCCLDLICKSIESQSLTFLEVCGPRSEDGFVLPIGY